MAAHLLLADGESHMAAARGQPSRPSHSAHPSVYALFYDIHEDTSKGCFTLLDDEQPLALDLRRQQNEASLPVNQEEEEEERRNEASLPVIQEEEEEEEERRDEESDPEDEGEAYEEVMELMRQQGLWRMRMELMDQIPGQPSRRDPECIYLVIELPSGNILMRRFRRSESLKYLHFFVLCHAEAPINFDILRDSTKRLLPCEPTRECPEPPTFEELGLLPIEKLIVLKADD
ncbi:FAS-associated factor 2-like [Rhipicephalus sanguineus]|uniref:FAS-associated factor 2-like n=1 Tax=Rhipicephalus sanguineus TaxID=34632 RepID=UPI001893FA38|nr:FAS-associated factor 2-like [Rhipicephalus sanguineus]